MSTHALLIILALALPLLVAGDHRTLALYDFEQVVHASTLDWRLREISGIAVGPHGRLYAHNDEEETVFVLDPMTGSILREFYLGMTAVHADFEDIAVVGDRIWMVTSSGELYEFPDGGEGRRVRYRVYRTPLDRRYDVEGLCYDPVTNTLLLACKGFAGPRYRDSKAVYSFSLEQKKLLRKPRFLIPRSRLAGIGHKGRADPSGIERHPLTGNFLLLSATGTCIVELSPTGEIIDHVRLARSAHPQAEGIAVLPSGDLAISDEGPTHGRLTIYPIKRH